MRSAPRALWTLVLLYSASSWAWSQDQVPAEPKPKPEAVAPRLGIGDPAPPIKIAGWSAGEPLKGLPEKQVSVVEFWATWCGPCLVSMPHLSELQHKYEDKVTFVGVTREDAKTVDDFLAKEQSPRKTWRDVIQYRLALDDGDVTNTAYMQAAGQNGIPTAFIVGKDGRIEWIGHPLTMDEPLAKIVASEWDREAAIVEFKKGQVFKVAVREISTLARAKEWDAALEQITALEAELPGDARIVQLRMAVFRMAGRTEELHAIEADYVKQIWDKSSQLNDYAWNQCLQSKKGNLPLALKAAERGVELTEEKDAPLLDTLARVHFELGDVKQALAWQKKAVTADQSGNAEITDALKRYTEALAASEKAETEK